MKLIEAHDYDELSRLAAELVQTQLERKPDSVLGLATGSTPVGMYQQLIAFNRNRKLHDVTTFNLDEYVGLGRAHPNSYYYFMRTQLFDHLDIPDANIHIPNGEAADIHEECAAYEERIEQSGGIDLQVLGIGVNGHIGFNEPGTPFTTKTHVVELHESTRKANQRFFESLEAVPTHAVTMGIDTIMRSRRIVLLISGKAKAEALHRLLSGPVTEDMPASVLKNHPDVTVIADRGALSREG